MTRQTIPKMQTIELAPPQREVPQLDEGVWQAWKEKNQRRDKMKFGRRVKVIAILTVLFGLIALQRVLG